MAIVAVWSKIQVATSGKLPLITRRPSRNSCDNAQRLSPSMVSLTFLQQMSTVDCSVLQSRRDKMFIGSSTAKSIFALLLSLSLFGCALAQDRWPQFRGSQSLGTA